MQEDQGQEVIGQEVTGCTVVSPDERTARADSWCVVTEEEEDVVDSTPAGRPVEKSRNSEIAYTDYEPFITRYFLQRFAQLDLST